MGVTNRKTQRALVSWRLNGLRRLLPGVRSYLRITPWLGVACSLLVTGAGTIASAQEPRLKHVEIFFATDRTAPQTGAKIAFGHAASETLTFGKALVALRVGAQPIFFDRFNLHRRHAPSVHDVGAFDVVSLSILDRARILALVADSGARAKGFDPKVLVFVHGFNTAFDEAVRRAAQISHDLGFDGPVFLFSWPSRGQSWSYETDQKTAANSRKTFSRFLVEDLAPLRPVKLQLLAHSMGSSVLVGAHEHILAAGSLGDVGLDEIVMIAPDVEGNAFLRVAREIGRAVKSTVYVANNDKALKLSECANRGARVGSFEGDKPVVAPFVDVIDVSEGSYYLDKWQHNRVFEHPLIFNDLRILLRDGTRPPNARSNSVVYIALDEKRDMLNGFWRFLHPDTDMSRDSEQELGWLNWLKWTGRCETAKK
jgi:esterase/lipase superfamily enzyme